MKIDLAAAGFEGVDWIDLYQDRNKSEPVVSKVMAFDLHYKCELLGYLRNYQLIKKELPPWKSVPLQVDST
jgi:hypothetical protein